MASLLYLGAGFGMLAINTAKRLYKREPIEAKMTKNELPYILGMIILDVAAPVCLMIGLRATTAANASLLSNFEIVATALIDMVHSLQFYSNLMIIGIQSNKDLGE